MTPMSIFAIQSNALNQRPAAAILLVVCDHELMVKRVDERGRGWLRDSRMDPAAAITRRASDRLRAGHLWVYRSDVESLDATAEAAEIAAGALVTVI